jgi:hypothetical protein
MVCSSKIIVEVEVTLRPTVSRPVRLGALPLLEQVIRCLLHWFEIAQRTKTHKVQKQDNLHTDADYGGDGYDEKPTPNSNKLNATMYQVYKMDMLGNLSKRVTLDKLTYTLGSMGSDSERNN